MTGLPYTSYKNFSPFHLACKINDVMKIQTKNMFLLKDVCFDYTKAEIYGILGETGNIYQVLNSKGP